MAGLGLFRPGLPDPGIRVKLIPWMLLIARLSCATVCIVSPCGPAIAQSAPNAADADQQVNDLLRRGDVARALEVFDARADQAKRFDQRQLAALAMGVLDQASLSDDEPARLEACLMLRAEGSRRCDAMLSALASRTDVPVVTR